MGAQPIAAPGWPEFACCTMSAASTRTRLTHRHSTLLQSGAAFSALLRLIGRPLESPLGRARLLESDESGSPDDSPSLDGR